MAQQLDAFPKQRAIRKDAGKPRPKKYPGKWGHGTSYCFSDARAFVDLSGRSVWKRLGLAFDALLGRHVCIDGELVVFAAQGARPKPGTPVVALFPNNGSELTEEACSPGTGY